MHNITRISVCLCVFAMLLATMIGCGNSQHSVSPEIDGPELIADSSNENHQLYGAWIAEFDPQSNSVEISPYRDICAHYNIRSMIPTPAITINSYIHRIMNVDVTIQNPFAYRAYDLRLIVYTDPIGHMLLNADNWTNLYDIPGGEIINPFKAYAKSEPHRLFAEFADHTENLRIRMPGDNFNVNFAIVVSFPKNCIEPYKIVNFTQDVLDEEAGSTTDISVDVLDWRTDVSAVYLYCPAIIGAGTLPLAQVDTETWGTVLTNDNGAPSGNYTGIVAAYSTNSGTLALYDKVTITVTSNLQFRVTTWGSTAWDVGHSVSCDSDGNTYITGDFSETVDFGDGNPLTSNGFCDAYLCKYNSNGDFQWVKTWGGSESDIGKSVSCDNLGNIYVTGHFRGTVDFNIGMPVSSIGEFDVYFLKYNSNGDVQWAKTWGGSDYDRGYSVSNDSLGNTHVTGYFSGTVYFGDGNPVTADGYSDGFLCTYNSNGVFQWVKTWGGSGAHDLDCGKSVSSDTLGNIYVTSSFTGTADFGDGNPITSDGITDAFLLKYNSNGAFQWVKTWGGSDYSSGKSVMSDSMGNTFVAGTFYGMVDFGDGNPINASGMYDAFLLKMDSDGNFEWVETWGGNGEDIGEIVAPDCYGDLYIIGEFERTVDFGNGNPITSNGDDDVYLLKLDSNGNFKCVSTWGGTDKDSGKSVTTDSSGDVYATGTFRETVDFGDGNPITSNGNSDAYLLKISAE